MGTKLQCEGYFPGHFSMRDLNDDSNSCSWPLFYGDKTFVNGQYYNGFLPKNSADAYPGYDRDLVRRTMLEHEAIFTDQLHELHRLYRIQRDLMDEVKRKELLRNQVPVDTSLSSSPLASQNTSEDARKWHISGFSMLNSVSTRLTTSCIEEIHSPFSSVKGSSAQVNPLPCQNGGISRDVEIVESRPTKVRRRMFDLQLPAEEYIFTEQGEKLMDKNFSSFSSCFPSSNHKIASENGSNLVLGNGRRNCGGDSSKSESCLRSGFNLADLNEPIEIQEIDAPGYVDLVGHYSLHPEVQGHETAAKLKSRPLGFPDKVPMNSRHSCYNGSLNNSHTQNSANSGLSKNNIVSSGHHAAKLPMSSQLVQTLFNKIHDPSSIHQSDQSNVGLLREKAVHELQASEKYNLMANVNHLESHVAPHAPSSYQVASSDLVNSWSPSVSSWEKPSYSSIQKSMSAQMQPYLNGSTNMSSEPSTQGQSLFGNRWNYNSTSTCDLHFGTEIPTRKGHYKESSSASKEPLICPPAGNYNHLNGSSSNHVATDQFVNHGSTKLYKGLNHDNLGSTKDLNLNAAYPSITSSKMDHQENCEFIDLERKNEDHLAGLPWPRSKLAPKNESTAAEFDLNIEDSSFQQPPLNQLFGRNETGEGIDFRTSQNLTSVSCSKNDPTQFDVNDSPSRRKTLSFPKYIRRNESSSFTSQLVPFPQASGDEENSRKNMVIDINIPCDPALSDFGEQITAEMSAVMEKQLKVANFKCEIDLNSCMSEDEASFVPSVSGSKVKLNAGIDLEAPLLPKSDEDVTPGEELQNMHEAPLELQTSECESREDESVRMAAEAIFAISSSIDQDLSSNTTVDATKVCMTDPLQWFVEIISSCEEDLKSCIDAASKAKDSENDKQPLTKELDYFESMTLKLTETKEEDYLPKPLVPETLILEETTTISFLTRTRRGQARRGRQRRDFQRDILPGLASLSRHEVTEDIQTFGGLMRATGYSWQSGLTRRSSTRSGSARGRRRVLISTSPPVVASPPCTPLIQHLTNNEVGLEDRSLTGWGKTTRRPRRQRYPAGNPPSIPLT